MAVQAAVGGTGRRSGDDGAQVAAAWAVRHLDTAADATFSRVLPSLGTPQLTTLTSVTGALVRAPHAVTEGREAMLAATVASIAVLWVLARRTGLARWSAAIAVAAFGMSPLAVDLHRTVHMANLAVPWMLAAFVAACAPGSRRLTHAVTGGLLAIAVLTEPVTIAAAPAVAWQLRRSTLPSVRPRALRASG
ncbi:MAG: glycosyltransferase, partial [Acidimicrobiales bacterium]